MHVRLRPGPPIARIHHFLLVLSLLLALLPAHPAAARLPVDDIPPPPAESSPPRNDGFRTGPSPDDPLEIALRYLNARRVELGLSEDDLSDIVVKDRYVTAHNGVTHLYLRQRLNGIELFNGDININISRDGRVINVGNRFVSNLRAHVETTTPTLPAVAAVYNVAGQLGLPVSEVLVATSSARGVEQAQEVSSGGFSADPIPVRLIYQLVEHGRVRLAWNMVIRVKEGSDWLDIRADATTGAILSQVNWTKGGRGVDGAAPRAVVERPAAAPLSEAAPNSYLVYALPADSPHDAGRALATDPADPIASPFGWHDVDGVPGGEYTTTRGNNAFAYADLASPDGFTAGDVTADGGASLVFSYTINMAQAPSTYAEASVTNLFFVTNQIHDILYHYGFDEVSGNFQQNNYGRGGQAGDYVLAEAQDYSGFVNANFSTPPDGMPPRMQMYLGASTQSFTVNGPAAIAGDYQSGSASFGPQTFTVTGDLVLVDDGVGATTDGCDTPFTSNVSGKIALIDRGNCTFKLKVYHAEQNGAIGVVIANHQVGAPPGLGDTTGVPDVTIPALSVTLDTGNAFKAQLAAPQTVNVTLHRGVRRDGSLDNGVVVHEYGHGVSNRLTGGPSNAGCLSTVESAGMGEGWSDFLTLALTAQPADTRLTPKVIGNWLMGYPAGGPGIRRAPYTTDMAANSHTFATTQWNNFVHDIGEVWATMLWEVYWNLVDVYGFDANLYDGAAGNNLALQLVLDGMKLQPCNPTFVEARDAILAADLVTNNGVNQCQIWAGFAKRGLGSNATAGVSSSITDSTESYLLPSACMVDVQPPAQHVCAPDNALYEVALGPLFEGAATLSVHDLPTNASAGFAPNPISSPTHSALTIGNTGAVLPGIYTIQVVGVGATQLYTTPVQLAISSAAPGAPVLTSPAEAALNAPAKPTFSWQAAPQAVEYLLEVAEDSAFSTLVFTTTTAATQREAVYSLRSGRTYHWRVTAQNGCGSAPSAGASFTVREFPRVLLVDDDHRTSGAANVRPYFEDALAALSVPYDIWDTGDSGGDEPTRLDDIADYATVIWFGGFYGQGPSSATEPLLGDFLEQGGCLFISAHEYFYASGLTPFMQEYLGVEEAEDDLGNGTTWHTVVTGVGPIYDGLGPYTLSMIQTNHSDILTPNADAGVAMEGNAGGAAIYKDAGHYRTTYWAFEFETLPNLEARTAAMARTLQWCDFHTDLGIAQTVIPATTLRPGQPLTYTLTYDNAGVAQADQVIVTATLPSAFKDWNVVSASAAITPVAGLGAVWRVADLAPGEVATITVSGWVDPALTADTLLAFGASIQGESYDSNPTNNSAAATARTVVAPRIRLTDPNLAVNEDAGIAAVVVSLDQPNPYAPVTASYSTSNGSAHAGQDFSPASGSVQIPAGALTATFPITIINDTVAESDETFQIALSNPVGAALGTPATGQVTIVDNDLPSVRFSHAVYTVTESSGAAAITVELDSPHPTEVAQVTYATGDGSAAAESDYTSVSGKVAFPIGVTTATFIVPLIDDALVEQAETVVLTLHDPVHALLGSPASATLVVIDDDTEGDLPDHNLPSVRFTRAVYTATEASGSAIIMVELSQPHPTQTVQVSYTTSNGSAQAGSDYVAGAGQLTFPMGVTATTFAVSILDDALVESDETVLLTLHSPVNAMLGSPASAALILIDDEEQGTSEPKVSVDVSSDPPPGAHVKNGGLITYTVTLTNSDTTAHQVVITAAIPAAVAYVEGSANPPPSDIVDGYVQVAGATAATATSLVWTRTLAGDSVFQASYTVVVVDDTQPLQSTVTVAVGDTVLQPGAPVIHNPTPPDEGGGGYWVHLPLLQR